MHPHMRMQTAKLCRWKIRKHFESELKQLSLRTAEAEEKADSSCSSDMIGLVSKALSKCVLTPEEESAWAQIGWDSIRTLQAVNSFKRHFGAQVSIDALLRITLKPRADLVEVADLVRCAMAGAHLFPHPTLCLSL